MGYFFTKAILMSFLSKEYPEMNKWFDIILKTTHFYHSSGSIKKNTDFPQYETPESQLHNALLNGELNKEKYLEISNICAVWLLTSGEMLKDSGDDIIAIFKEKCEKFHIDEKLCSKILEYILDAKPTLKLDKRKAKPRQHIEDEAVIRYGILKQDYLFDVSLVVSYENDNPQILIENMQVEDLENNDRIFSRFVYAAAIKKKDAVIKKNGAWLDLRKELEMDERLISMLYKALRKTNIPKVNEEARTKIFRVFKGKARIAIESAKITIKPEIQNYKSWYRKKLEYWDTEIKKNRQELECIKKMVNKKNVEMNIFTEQSGEYLDEKQIREKDKLKTELIKIEKEYEKKSTKLNKTISKYGKSIETNINNYKKWDTECCKYISRACRMYFGIRLA